MKIFYIAPFATKFPSTSASSIHMIRMCEALAFMGNDVTLCIGNSEIVEEEILEFYGVLNRFKLVSVKGIVPKADRVIYSYRAASLAKCNGAELVISRSSIPSLFSAKRFLPTVYDTHGPVWEKNFIEYQAYKLLRKSRYLKRVTTNSGKLKEMYEKANLAPIFAPIIAAFNGATKHKVKNGEIPELPGRAFLKVGYTGHLYEGRGIDVLLDVSKSLPDVDFHFFGGTPEDLKFWRSKIENAKNVFFHGFIQPGKLHVYREACDVLVAPYQAGKVAVSGGKGDTSGYMNPIKVIEYLSSGKALVLSDLPAIREVVPEGVAFFVKFDDVDAWVDAIEKLKNNSLRTELANRASAIFSDSLTWTARARKLVE
ncbi:glycosyltransferase family 4 protein [Aliidiomarina soli]|uniref:glycosyltransferase family 4 protein n=1 Tax=Aliidiomarina soli TaxID=1928574 RepID=UPI0013002891|nr:glycosyltransferase family 4 protein [Aliidiomarina soli]